MRYGWDSVYTELIKSHGYTRRIRRLCPHEPGVGKGTKAAFQSGTPVPRTEDSRRKVQIGQGRRCFYNWEKFVSVQELNGKLKIHLSWSNNKPVRIFGWLSPLECFDALFGPYR